MDICEGLPWCEMNMNYMNIATLVTLYRASKGVPKADVGDILELETHYFTLLINRERKLRACPLKGFTTKYHIIYVVWRLSLSQVKVRYLNAALIIDV